MSTVQPPVATPAFRDQSTGLMLFGIFQIVLGCFAGLMTLFMIGAGLMPTMANAPHGPAVDVRMMIPAAGVYLVVAVILLLTFVLAYVAWGTYRLQTAAWWGALLLTIAGTVNMVLTFSKNNLMEMYEKMNMPAAQLEMIRKSGMVESMSHWAPWIGLVGGALWLGYLLYVRRYFVGEKNVGQQG
jgi:hypothetical protein